MACGRSLTQMSFDPSTLAYWRRRIAKSGRPGRALDAVAYWDSHYGSGQARADYQAAGHDAVIKPIPLRPAVPGGFSLDDLAPDEARGTVTCPAGHTRAMSSKRRVTFGTLCGSCPLRARCTTAKTAGPWTSTRTRACCAPPEPRPARRNSAGLPDTGGDRAGHRLDRYRQPIDNLSSIMKSQVWLGLQRPCARSNTQLAGRWPSTCSQSGSRRRVGVLAVTTCSGFSLRLRRG